MLAEKHQKLADFIFGIANKLRGPYRPPQYRRVMLPMIVLRRFDCVLAPGKEAARTTYDPTCGKIDILGRLAEREVA
jgi:type I restriction enzyme M protein